MRKIVMLRFVLFETYIPWSSSGANMAFQTVPAFISGQDYSFLLFWERPPSSTPEGYSAL